MIHLTFHQWGGSDWLERTHSLDHQTRRVLKEDPPSHWKHYSERSGGCVQVQGIWSKKKHDYKCVNLLIKKKDWQTYACFADLLGLLTRADLFFLGIVSKALSHADEEIIICVRAHSDFAGRWSSCPKKLHNAQMCKRSNWEVNALKLQEKKRIYTNYSQLYWNRYFHFYWPRILYIYVLYWQVYPILLKSESYWKENVFPSVGLPENI